MPGYCIAKKVHDTFISKQNILFPHTHTLWCTVCGHVTIIVKCVSLCTAEVYFFGVSVCVLWFSLLRSECVCVCLSIMCEEMDLHICASKWTCWHFHDCPAKWRHRRSPLHIWHPCLDLSNTSAQIISFAVCWCANIPTVSCSYLKPAFFNQTIQLWFGFLSEVWLGIDFSKNMALIELLQQSLMTSVIIMWQFCLVIIYFSNTRRYNNVSWYISIEAVKVIVSTGNAEMKHIFYSVTMAPSCKCLSIPTGKLLFHGFYSDTSSGLWTFIGSLKLLNLRQHASIMVQIPAYTS